MHSIRGIPICAGFLLTLMPACSSSSSPGSSATVGSIGTDSGAASGTDLADGGGASVPVPITAPPPGKWANLIAQAWKLDPGTEGYWCKRVTVAEDIWVSGFRSLAPHGTHHTTLGKDSGGPDGTFPCGGFSTGSELLYGSGVGTDPTEFPGGFAVKIAAGEQLLLNLHVNNVTAEVLTGTSAIEVMTTAPAEVVQEVGFVLAGKSGGLTVAPGLSTQTGTCTVPVDVTVLTVGPHMHTRGVHQLVTTSSGSGTQAPLVLLDRDYSFTQQTALWLAPPAVIPAGGHLDVTCTYQNDTANTIVFGEHTGDEMCYAGLYHYPRFQSGSTCVR